jgi:polyhydroxybutyrate depolymerase
MGIVLLAACSESKEEPKPFRPSPESAPPPVETSTPTKTDPPPAPKEPEWVWTPPVVATTSPACGGNVADMNGTDEKTPSGRSYRVYGPNNYDPKKTYPVVLTYHGYGSSGPDFQSWFHMDDYVDGEAFVVYPTGINGVWDLSGTADLVFFDEMVKKLGETYCINPSRVFAFGFSYGAFFADYLGCKRAGYVKAVSMGDGGRGGEGKRCGRLPVLVTHRTADPDEVVSKGKVLTAHWAQLNECGTAAASDTQFNCMTHGSCKNPGVVTFCEDTWYDASWKPEWNHTVREEYRAYTWKWFKALP